MGDLNHRQESNIEAGLKEGVERRIQHQALVKTVTELWVP
jgi:hypothetical protein